MVDADPDVDQVHVLHVDVGGPEDVEPGGELGQTVGIVLGSAWPGHMGRKEHFLTYIRQEKCRHAAVAFNTLDFGIKCFVRL